MTRCFYTEVIQETANPLNWIVYVGFTNKTTGKNEEITLHGSSEKENSGHYSYKPPYEGKEMIICGDVEGVRIMATMVYSVPCTDKDLPVWIGFENRRNSTHPPSSEEQKKMEECLKRNNIDPESMIPVDNDNCTN